MLIQTNSQLIKFDIVNAEKVAYKPMIALLLFYQQLFKVTDESYLGLKIFKYNNILRCVTVVRGTS